MIFDKLKQFRQSAYMLLGQAKDAVCDLIDVLTTKVKSFVELSLSPVFRKWEVYAALTDGRPPEADEVVYCTDVNGAERPLLAGDHTAWPRPEARTLDRTIEHQPTAISGNKPISVGYGFSTIASIPQGR